MKAMIFTAGFGTRMAPLTDRIPKPAMPFFGRPLIAHTLEWLSGQGVDSVVLNLHHLPEVVRAAALDHCPKGLELHFSEETDILGTGGGLAAARHHFPAEDGPFLAVNGDIFTQMDLRMPLRVHDHRKPSATLVLHAGSGYADLFGVGLDLDKRILDFWGDPEGTQPFRRCAFTGVHVIEPELVDRLPKTGYACIKEQGYLPLLHEGGILWGTVSDESWFDLGTPARYLAAHLGMIDQLSSLVAHPLISEQVAAAEPPPPNLTIIPPVVLGSSLRVEGAATVGPAAFIGDGVCLRNDALVTRSIVWDGTTVDGQLIDSIAAPNGLLSGET